MTRGPASLLLAGAFAAVLAAGAGAVEPAPAPDASAPGISAPEASVAGGPVLDDRAVLNPLAEVTLEAMVGFSGRPLFVPTRRPPPPPVVEAPEPEPEPVVVEEPEPEEDVAPPSVLLSGIVEIDEVPVAMLRSLDEDRTMAVRVGETVDEWTVSAIGEAEVTLELDGEEHAIRIFQPGEDATDPSRVLRPGAAAAAAAAAAAGDEGFDGRASRMRDSAAERFRRARDAALDPDNGGGLDDRPDDGAADEDVFDDGSGEDPELYGDDPALYGEDPDLYGDDSDLYGSEDEMPLDAADDFGDEEFEGDDGSGVVDGG